MSDIIVQTVRSNGELTPYFARKLNTTIRVAASNSSANAKQRADYLCDGVDDQVQIQAAIDSIALTGGTVQLESGNYSVTSAILITTSNIAIIGRGRNTIITPVWNALSPQAYVIRCDGPYPTYLTKLSFSNFAIVTTAPFDVSTNGGFIGVVWGTLFFQYCSNFQVDNIYGERVGFLVDTRTCEKFSVSNIRTKDSAGCHALVTCSDVIISHMVGDNVKVVVDFANVDNATATQISGTMMALADPTLKVGIDMGSCRNVAISGGSLRGFWAGVHFKHEGFGTGPTSISGLTLEDCILAGVYVNMAGHITGERLGSLLVDTCTFKGTGSGVNISGYAKDITVSNCDINVASYGVVVANGSNNTKITGSTVRSTGEYAIFGGLLAGNTGLAPDGLIVSGCTLQSSGTNATVFLSEFKNINFFANTIESSGGHGV